MIHVAWVSYHQPKIMARGYWDEGLLERLFSRELWRPVTGYEYEHHIGIDAVPAGHGAVVVLPAQHHVNDVARLNDELAGLPWCVLILAGDECSLFPWREVTHPNMRRWVMTPRPGLHAGAGRFIGEGWPVDTPDVLAQFPPESPRWLDWFFAGQVTHERRRHCVEALAGLESQYGQLIETPGFARGLPRPDYLARMAGAKVVPCPSGPGTPDSFRLYEALEAGALPLADAVTSAGWEGYWPFLFGEEPPFPVVGDWADLPDIMAKALAGWPANANRASAWWQIRKRRMSYAMETDVGCLSSQERPRHGPEDLITVLIPTSPTPNNPDTSIITDTIASIRAQPDLARAEIVVMIDGVRAEQADRRGAYEEYVRRLLLICGRSPNVVPVLAEEHIHQANLARLGLELVRTPTIAFVEHDTPIEGPVPWGAMANVITSGVANVIRLHHEAHVLPVHRHLMLDEIPHDVGGVPLLRCAQWSQRPHLASTGFYRRLITTHFGRDSRTMIEDVVHGALDQAWREHGEAGWDRYRVWMYAPPGDIRRTLHTDGRGNDPKYDMVYAYDGDPPEGSPRATAERVD